MSTTHRPTPIERRRFLATLTAGLALLAPGAGAAPGSGVHILCLKDFVNPPLLDAFTARSGMAAHMHGAASESMMVARLRSGDVRLFDLASLTHPWIRRILHPYGLAAPLDANRFAERLQGLLARFRPPYRWIWEADGQTLLGIPHRFGTSAFVVDRDKIGRGTAENIGFDLFNDPALKRRYGVLLSGDWTLAHLCLIAGQSPFRRRDKAGYAHFAAICHQVLGNAALITRAPRAANRALAAGVIDIYLGGGLHTVAPARAAGARKLVAIVPRTGPIDGKGGLRWVQIITPLARQIPNPAGTRFIDDLFEPALARRLAHTGTTFSPVAQMGDPATRALFSADDLEALQWDRLGDDWNAAVDTDLIPDRQRLYDIFADILLTYL